MQLQAVASPSKAASLCLQAGARKQPPTKDHRAPMLLPCDPYCNEENERSSPFAGVNYSPRVAVLFNVLSDCVKGGVRGSSTSWSNDV